MHLAIASFLFLLTISCAVFSAQGSYSTKTVSGASCIHECGTHGYDYYWCYTGGSNWDYCCKPTHPCGHHGESYTWCHNGHSWSYCHLEVEDSRQKTIHGTACRTGHDCGTHGESYNWCYTRYSWDYCCKPSHDCGPHGEYYNWCYIGGGSWKKCYLHK